MQYSKLRSTLLISTIFCAQSIAQTTAPAPAPAAPAAWSVGPINFSGLVDGYYNYASNHPGSRTNLYRNFDVRANSMSLNMAKLTLEHDADPIGFKLDLGFGRAMDIFNFQDTANGFDNLRYVPQAYVTFKPKNGKGFQMDFGKFYTSAGAEPTETHLNWNYSRALMYANGPYYHFGLRTSMPVNKYLTAGDTTKVEETVAAVRAMLNILGVDPMSATWDVGSSSSSEMKSAIDALVAVALDQRKAARERKDYAAADSIRDQLAAAGIAIEDTPEGPRWSLDDKGN